MHPSQLLIIKPCVSQQVEEVQLMPSQICQRDQQWRPQNNRRRHLTDLKRIVTPTTGKRPSLVSVVCHQMFDAFPRLRRRQNVRMQRVAQVERVP